MTRIFHWFFLCERWIPCQALTSVLCLHYRPETVHCSTKDVYTSEITFLAIHPWFNLKSDRVNLVAPDSPIECLLYLPNLSGRYSTTGKVDPARKFKCNTTAHGVPPIQELHSGTLYKTLWAIIRKITRDKPTK